MAQYTFTLPEELLSKIKSRAKRLDIPMNKLIEKALSTYFEHLERDEYITSFERAAKDKDMIKIAEEDMNDYEKYID